LGDGRGGGVDDPTKEGGPRLHQTSPVDARVQSVELEKGKRKFSWGSISQVCGALLFYWKGKQGRNLRYPGKARLGGQGVHLITGGQACRRYARRTAVFRGVGGQDGLLKMSPEKVLKRKGKKRGESRQCVELFPVGTGWRPQKNTRPAGRWKQKGGEIGASQKEETAGVKSGLGA